MPKSIEITVTETETIEKIESNPSLMRGIDFERFIYLFIYLFIHSFYCSFDVCFCIFDYEFKNGKKTVKSKSTQKMAWLVHNKVFIISTYYTL